MSTLSNSVTAFVAQVEAFFKNAETKFENFAAEFLPQVGNVLEVALEDLAQVAGAAVLAEAPKLISGQEKFGNAVANVVQTVEAQGKTVAIQTAQTAVQTAYLTAVQVAQGK